ncbi:hypothetical protein I5U67_08825 [Stenotrophomonas maltophilia]|uniref:Uncharacterized protein n=1 Tax=Stenotrophomonas maltophilia TaxID=40324 RepID=A0A6B8J114_STEMA|nr:hypothetical protein [Stenotrophomonas maltophilia]MBH1652271.1 hypothetical protein [Stenotrophomonas maltophilia]QGL99847.1 hypothetical protein FEO89_03400 [Stenotrophomonas maltophilia]HDS1511319.1 hypothetical protein [Stenotrophomonas maltophilia]
MTAAHYPYLYATLGETANQLPDDLARTLETTLCSLQAGAAADGVTLLGCLRTIHEVDAADGQLLPSAGRTQSQRWALSRIDRANAGLTFLVELLQASERVRVDGDESQQLDDGAREALLLACRGLCEYVGMQVHAA